ncbi:MAG: GPR endopeptidase [Syntrophomonadaceae bacterium]|nr:GPR endopeptidase [Syntrophomonadaceae bacterium]
MDELHRSLGLFVDMAVEAHAMLRGDARVEVPGVREQVQEREHCKVVTIDILDAEGAARMGRPQGSYITIEAPPLKINDPYVREDIIEAIKAVLARMLEGRLNPQDTVLLVGLGNRHAVADSLGPRFIEYSPITRHYYRHVPEALVEGMRPSCGIAPGVLGLTGLESFEVIRGIVDKVKPALLITVDSLAAQDVRRIGNSIQICDTGIQPGGGVNNAREAITQEGLGVPVIAIGCPTIVNAALIAQQAVKSFCTDSGVSFDEIRAVNIIRDILAFYEGGLAVTPKEVDDIIKYTAQTIAMGVGCALFPGIEVEQLEMYSQ